MEAKLRIIFIKDWHDDAEHFGGNFDGILGAIAELSKRHSLLYVTRGPNGYGFFNGISHRFVERLSDVSFSGADAIVCWGSLDRPWHNELPPDVPAFLCFAGGPTDHPFLSHFQHIFVESKTYEDDFRSRGLSVSRAFGVNTSVFKPNPRMSKVFDAIYPASFCFHKNQEVFARAMGPRGLCVGTWNEEDIAGKCLSLGTPIMRRVSSNVLSDLFNMSRCTVIPCGPAGGSQRTVLESMACGVPVVLARDNDKCREFVEESGFGVLVDPIPEAIREAVESLKPFPFNPEKGLSYVQSRWTHVHYANAIEKELLHG